MYKLRWGVILLLGVLVGCGNDAQERMGGTVAPSWPELATLQDTCITAIGMGMDMEGPKSALQAASAPAFKEAIDGFEGTPIPSQFASGARESAKTELIKNLRAFAEGGTDDELKALWDKIQQNVKTLTAP